MFILEEKHLDQAKIIASNARTKKTCNNCYDRGYIGTTEDNLLVLCTKCVDMDKAMEDWKEYVSQHEDLKEHFHELFEEKPAEEETPNVTTSKSMKHFHENSKMNKMHFATNVPTKNKARKIGEK